MAELQKICRVVERELPEADFRKYLVLDATTGQNAVSQAQIFSEDIDTDGIILTKHAMEYHLGAMGGWYLTAAIFLFAYSTIIANYFYGETNIRFIYDKPWTIFVFRLLSGIVVLIGGYLTLQQAWSIVDLAMALMTILNLIAVVCLSKYAFRLLQDYLQQRKEGKDPVFHKEMFPNADIEGWD